VIDIDVTVVLLEVKSPVVYVFGRVNKPGAIVMQGPLDVWRTVGEAGGFTPDADRSNVILTRSTSQGDRRFVLDFLAWQHGSTVRDNAAVQRGDVIFVPESAARYVYVLGEVEKPGRVALGQEEVIRASQALAMGGRILSSASREDILILRTNKRREPVVIELNLLDVMQPDHYDEPGDYTPRDPVLQSGDVVYVPSSKIGDVNRFAETWFTNGIWAIIPFNVTANYNMNN
jgi:polysaccharide export outer membrane protein